MNSRLLGLAVAICTSSTAVFGQECVQTVVVTGYANVPAYIPIDDAQLYPTYPIPATRPGGAYAANPNQHTNCSSAAMDAAMKAGDKSSPSQPTNTALPIPVRNANPIDISNGSPIAAQYGGVNNSSGFVVFPNLAKGVNAALASVGTYAQNGYTVSGLVNAWAPPASNPNTMANFLSALGITQSAANATSLSTLTSEQLMQVIAAFTWQEGFKPPGC